MDLQCMGMCLGAVYGPVVYRHAVYGYVLRGSIWTCSDRYVLRASIWTAVMDQQCMVMCSGEVYGPTVYGYVLRGSI